MGLEISLMRINREGLTFAGIDRKTPVRRQANEITLFD